MRSVGASSREGGDGEQAPQPMDAPGGAGGRVPAGVGRRCSASRSAEASSRMARQGGAGGRRSQGEALPQRAGERRIGANNLVEQGEPGAGAESRLEAYVGANGAYFGGRAQDGNARSDSGLATRRGKPARPPPGRDDRRLPKRIGGGRFVSEGVGGRESNHGQA